MIQQYFALSLVAMIALVSEPGRCLERLDDADDGDDVAGQTRIHEIFGELAVHLSRVG